MSEAKFTPGPWKVDREDGAHQPSIVCSEKLIASVGNAEPWHAAKPEWLTNAHLIASAPDLYEALEAFVSDCTNDECERCIRARKALSRARGEVNEDVSS